MLGTLKIYSWLFFAFLFSILSSMHVTYVSCHCPESERYHLLQLKASLKYGGQYSGQKLVSWNNQSLDCCSWSGVDCSADGKVVLLDLSEEGITEGINYSSSLFSLKHLEWLNLAHNDLHGVFPKEIFHLPTLKVVDLSGNGNLEGSFPEISKNNSLEELVLSDTYFTGGIPNSIIENLKSLSRLDISRCGFNGTIPKSLSNLTKLTHIDLSDNRLVGSIPSFSLLTDLTYLALSRNQLTGSLLSTHWEGLTKLETLDLGMTSLNGSIPKSVFRAPSLKHLFLYENRFSEISNEYLNMSLSSSPLSEIYLRDNNINGHIPHFFFELKELSILQLLGNNFYGPLPDFGMKNLMELDLSSNNLSGPFPNSLSKYENLSRLDLSHNNFSGIFDLGMINRFHHLFYIDLSFSGLLVVDNGVDVPSSLPSLLFVKLASCGLKRFPRFLRNLSHSLEYLDLSQNQISGEIPNWIWGGIWEGMWYDLSLNLSHNFLEYIEQPVLNVSSIQSLDLHSNRLRGELPPFLPNAQYLDYSMNNFSSSIPPSIPRSDLYFLSLSNNNLNGSIPESICNSSGISILDLSNNSLSGPVPQCISTLMKRLVVLNLGMNHLNGTISDALLQPGCQLETLDLNRNYLSGKVPKSLLNCKELQVLNLGNNQINDTFPCWLKELNKLSVLVLTSNKFHGKWGCPETNGSWPLLQIMDLSSNTFSGKLFADSFSTLKAMMVVNESQSTLKGFSYGSGYYQDTVTVILKNNEVKLEKILRTFTSIDLSDNFFEGEIPQELGNLRAIHCLNLSRNNFMGKIPSSLGRLNQLESLDLSSNKLSGPIPQQLADLTFLAVLNLSYNQLEGRIPSGDQLDNFCEDSFLGNKGLVGPQVKRKCTDNDGEAVALPATPLHDNNTRANKSEVRWELIGAEVGFTVGLGIIIGSLVFWQRWREWYFERVERVLLEILCHQNQRRPNQLRRKGGN